MSEVAVVVEFVVKPGKRDDFLAIIREHAKATLASEPGCKRFDVLVPKEGADRVFLCEVYADDAAFAHHGAQPRLAQVRQRYADLIQDRRLAVCSVG